MKSGYVTCGGSTLLALVLGMSMGAASADVLLEYSGSSEACHGEFARLALSGPRLRVEPPPPMQGHAMIYDGTEKLAVSLDAEQRSYFEFEMDEDALDYHADVMNSTSTMMDKKLSAVLPGGMAAAQGMGQSAQLQAILQQNLEQMPKEQREQMQEALKAMQDQGVAGFAATRSPPLTEVTGETRTIDGLRCVVQRVTQDGTLLQEECVAQFDALGLQVLELKRLQKSLRNFDALGAAMSKFRLAGMTSPPPPIERSGLALQRRCYDQGRETGVVHLHLTRPGMPGSLFEIPAGYQPMDLNDAGAGMR